MVRGWRWALVGLAVAFLAGKTAGAAPILSVEVVSPVSEGASVDAEIRITEVSDLYAFEFDVAFDPAVVEVMSIGEGAFLSGAGATFFVPGTINNALGRVELTANTLLTAVSGASGSGTLAKVRFLAAAPGVSALTVGNVILLDSALEDIDVEVRGGRLVVEPIATPEPGTLLLIGAGLSALAWRRRA